LTEITVNKAKENTVRNDVPTMQAGPAGADPVAGRVRWAPGKSLWLMAMTAGGVAAPLGWFSWGGALLFLASTGATLCLGHSLGMHRRFIHRSYQAPLWLEHVLVYLGTLVGMAGPLGMMRTHDLRDWAQRQPQCHDYFGHRRSFLHDGWWQLHCDVVLDRPPRFTPPSEIAHDRFYAALERTWMWQQLPWALAFWAVGGIGWVLWGVCARVAVGVTGHWFIGHFAHRRGHQGWQVHGAAVQGFNVQVPGLGPAGAWLCGLVTLGEGWHNNHHAFPASSRLGLQRHQWDPGWWVLCVLRRAGLVSHLALPADLPHRPALVALNPVAAAGETRAALTSTSSVGRPS
jgi:fatty-acid desaturase